MHKVKSSQIESIGHDGTELHIKFNSGSTYSYSNVDDSLFNRFLDAPSAGKFFQAEIKSKPGLYPFRKL